MTPLSATTLATSERIAYPDVSFYVTSAHLQIPVLNGKTDPQHYASVAMSKLREKETDIQLIAPNNTMVSDDTGIPKDKSAFNRLFCTSVKKNNRENENHAILIFSHLRSNTLAVK